MRVATCQGGSVREITRTCCVNCVLWHKPGSLRIPLSVVFVLGCVLVLGHVRGLTALLAVLSNPKCGTKPTPGTGD